MSQRICSRCGRSLPKTTEFFQVDRKKSSGLRPDCKQCRRAARRAAYLSDRERILIQTRKYEKENWQAVLERKRKKRKTYPEQYIVLLRQRAASWRALNPERVSRSYKLWMHANRGKYNAKCAAARAARRDSVPPWLTVEQKTQIALTYESAALAGNHVDHIVPIRGELVCGLHVPWNLQILPPLDNLKKGNRFVTA